MIRYLLAPYDLRHPQTLLGTFRITTFFLHVGFMVPWILCQKDGPSKEADPYPYQYLQHPEHQLRHASMPKLRNQVPSDISSGASGARQLHEVQDIKRCRAALERAIPAPVVM